MAYAKSLSAVTQDDLSMAGRKGLDLALLAEHKFVVPDTMVITSDAFEAVLAEGNLRSKLNFLMGHIEAGSAQSLMNVYSGVRRALSEAKLPAQLEADLREAYESVSAEGIGLREKRRPVRVIVSTNRDEDPESNDTVIQNVLDQTELLIAVREAWALAYLPSQLKPRLDAKFPEKELRIALLVQAMGETTVSVHAYSCVPEDKGKVYLQVYQGELDLREKVVKDYYAISRDKLHIVASELNHQPSKLERQGGNLVLVQLPSTHKEDKLIKRELEELARLAKKAERTLQSPVKLFFSSREERHALLWANRLGFSAEEKADAPTAARPPAGQVEVVDLEPQVEEASPPPEVVQQEPLAAAVVPVPRSSNAKLLAASLQLATLALRKRYEMLFGQSPDGFPEMVSQLNAHQAFSRQLDEPLLKKAHDAVKTEGTLSDDDYSRAVEEIAYLLANA